MYICLGICSHTYTYNTYPLKLETQMSSGNVDLIQEDLGGSHCLGQRRGKRWDDQRPSWSGIGLVVPICKSWWLSAWFVFTCWTCFFLNKTPMGKTHMHIIWDLKRETWLRSGMYFRSPDCQKIFKKHSLLVQVPLLKLWLYVEALNFFGKAGDPTYESPGGKDLGEDGTLSFFFAMLIYNLCRCSRMGG